VPKTLHIVHGKTLDEISSAGDGHVSATDLPVDPVGGGSSVQKKLGGSAEMH